MIDSQTQDTPTEGRLRPLPLLLALLFAGLAVGLFLLPEKDRPWNFGAFGAIALFLAARGGRLGLPVAIALTLGAKLLADYLNYRQHGFDPDYLPISYVYGPLAVYALCGWALLRHNATPRRLAVVTVAASAAFFLITNFFDWVVMSLPYNRGPLGLLESYWMGLPFWRGTLISDLLFTGVLFGLEYVILHATAPKPAAIPVIDERGQR